jgi:hypothetical protein
MTKSIWVERDRQELIRRLEKLTPETRAQWGSMNASKMVMHLIGWMRMATGELPIAPRRLFMRHPVVKQAVIYLLPWPKGVPTAPELITSDSDDFARDHALLLRSIRTLEKPAKASDWPPHPAFGRLSIRTWGALGYRHTDHHLRQFGL